MLEEITERIKKVSEGVFTTGSRAGTPQENGISAPHHSFEDDLLIAVIILGIIVFALILIIIYGYCKYIRKRTKGMENRERELTENMREATGDFEQPSTSNALPDASHVNVPVKMRKRSMTFSETDEECRKYREDLEDTMETLENGERSRKKSVVTFAGTTEIDLN